MGQSVYLVLENRSFIKFEFCTSRLLLNYDNLSINDSKFVRCFVPFHCSPKRTKRINYTLTMKRRN